MIQRIQSIYLLLGAALMGTLPFLPQAEAVTTTYPWFPLLIGGGSALTALVALWAMFLYKNRKFQRRMIVWVQLLAVLILAVLLVIFATTGVLQNVYGADGLNLVLAGMVLMPVVAYLFFFLARRAVDQDIALVASMDRIR